MWRWLCPDALAVNGVAVWAQEAKITQPCWPEGKLMLAIQANENCPSARPWGPGLDLMVAWWCAGYEAGWGSPAAELSSPLP